MELISSTNNPKIKNLVKLQKSSERKAQNRILIEGWRESYHAIKAGFEIEQIYFCREVAKKDVIEEILSSNIPNIYELTLEPFKKTSYRENFDGIVSIAKPIYHKLNDLSISENPLILVLETVEKPGNLGAILRTAEAAQIDALILCDQQTDLYNPNVIRSSLGCVFKVPTILCKKVEAIDWMKKNKIKSYAAALTAKNFYHEFDFTTSSAVVLGSEAYGLTDEMISMCDEQIKIPMLGEHDSLNVSVSAAILTFEAKRQRNFKF